MTFDTNGAILEGIRVSTGNSAFTFPPRSFVSDSTLFSSVDSRAEYALMVSHIDSTVLGTDMGDSGLYFYWTKNEGSVVRFDFDNFNRRWNTLPGGTPDVVGKIGNSPRLKAPIPDFSISSSPYSLYIGSPERILSFSIQVVNHNSEFSDLPAGSIQISRETGEINFGQADLLSPAYVDQIVYLSKQSFSDRSKNNGNIGSVPTGLDSYNIILNPIPGTGQFPRVRIGFRSYLTPIEVSSEALFGIPSPGTFQWSSDTGKIRLCPSDLSKFASESLYYDGVLTGRSSLTRVSLGKTVNSWPTPSFSVASFVSNSDLSRFCIFSDINNVRSYFQVIIIDQIPNKSPSNGSLIINSSDGSVYMSFDDVANFGSSMSYVDTILQIDNGISVQFFRSAVNVSGLSEENDFTFQYHVSRQILTDNIIQSPFVFLPVVPLVDSFTSFNVDSIAGSTGTFTGELVDSKDPTKIGFGYNLDLDNRKLEFTNRKKTSLVLEKDQDQVKLVDSIILESGFKATRDGVPIEPNVDFDFNKTTGLLEFISPVGEDDPRNVIGIVGEFLLPNLFKTNGSPFLPSHKSRYLFVQSGLNAGVYKIVSVPSAHTVTVDSSFVQSGSGSADIRFESEVVADRFWQDFNPPYKKLSITRQSGSSDQSSLLSTDFSVFPTTSQINIASPAKPDDVFIVNYISLDSSDEGVTVTPTSRTEYAAFKIRQESAKTTPGSTKVFINPNQKTVDTSRPISIYVDGVTQEDGSFSFVSPGTLSLSSPITTEQVTVDYWIREAIGGETNFNLLHSPMDVDVPKIVSGEKTSLFNSNQTSVLMPGGAFLLDNREVFIIKSVSYDPINDMTAVDFEETPVVASDTNSKFQITQSISSGDYRISENLSADAFIKNTSILSVNGRVPFSPNMVVTINDDPYLVSAVKYDSIRNKTLVMTSSPAKFNYIIPRITRTIRPVLSPSSSFQTSKNAHMGYPFTLVLGGSNKKVLKRDVDFQVGEGGLITLKSELRPGSILYAFYVARVTQTADTIYELNYSYAIAPNDQNGIRGQRLVASYNLYSPDTFFFRVETIGSFLPEVIQELQKSGSSGSSSGPNIGDSTSLKTRDYGIPGLYFDEQHINNLDIVISRLLKFYNDLINGYEDILANLDGRVVGAQSGRFRYDGRLSNDPRNDYLSITNDIDDLILLYNEIVLSGFFSFTDKPVYGPMWQSNGSSRFFPTQKTVTAALNNQVGSINLGKVLGTLGLSNITSVGLFTSTPSSSQFVSDTTGTVLTILNNGDSGTLNPPFSVGKKVNIYSSSGVFDRSANITSVTGSGPYQIVIDSATPLFRGGVLQDTSDTSVPSNHFYTPGRDVGYNADNGQILNMSFPPPLDSSQSQVVGNELVDSLVSFQNLDTAPRRIPALDGLDRDDNGSVQRSFLKYDNETDLLNQELFSIQGFTTAAVSMNSGLIRQVTIHGVLTSIGDSILFLAGSNSGVSSTVVSVTPSGPDYVCIMDNSYPFTTGDQSCIRTVSHQPTLQSILKTEISVVSSNVASPPPTPLSIGTLDNEMSCLMGAMNNIGSELVSSVGSFSGTTLTDTSINFPMMNVVAGSIIVINSGPNIGIYKVSVVNINTLVIDNTPPFISFSGGTSPYSVIQPPNFLSSKEFDFVNPFIQKSILWVSSTNSWLSSYSVGGIASRQSDILGRKADVVEFMSRIEDLLGKGDKLYDSRYLWISSRIDKKNGLLTRKSQATNKRLEETSRLQQDQQRQSIVKRLT